MSLKLYVENSIALRLIVKFNQSGGVFSRHKIQDFGYEGRADVESTVLNPAGSLISWEHLGNQVRDKNTF